MRVARHLNEYPLEFPLVLYRKKPERLAELLAEVVGEAAELIEALSPSEFESLVAAIPPGYRMFLDDLGRETPHDRERVAVYYVGAEVHRRYFSISDVLESAPSESAILRQYPELRELFDADGLLRLDDRFKVHDGGIEYRNHVFHYHQFLRRSYTSNPNYEFLSRFIRCREETQPANAFRIALDHRRLMPLDAFRHMMECDVWQGPTFRLETLDDPNAIGVTIVKRIDYPALKLHYDLDRTEILWTFRDGIKTLQIEEVSNQTAALDHLIVNRYVHSERDIKASSFRHLDGAAKVYLIDQYSDRFNATVPNEPRAHRRLKLWRVDGAIPLGHWLDLIGYFFKGNEMLLEYFDPEAFHASLIAREQARQEWLERQRR